MTNLLHPRYFSRISASANSYLQWKISQRTPSVADILLHPLPFLGKTDPKNKKCQFKQKFDAYTNSTMLNSIVMLTFSVLDQKYPFWANLIKKIKIISLSWNLVPRLIRTCTIQWRFSLFPYSAWKFCSRNLLGILILPD